MSSQETSGIQHASIPPIKPHHSVIVSNSIPLTTRAGFEFHVRPVERSDKEAFAEFFSHVTKDDLRFRFFSGMPDVRESLLDSLIDVDHDKKEDYLAFDIDDKTIIASAMIGVKDDKSEAEVAIVERGDYKHRGMGWTFLEYVVEQARQDGIKMLTSLESRDNHATIELEKEMGFSAKTCSDDATLVRLEFDLTANSVEA